MFPKASLDNFMFVLIQFQMLSYESSQDFVSGILDK